MRVFPKALEGDAWLRTHISIFYFLYFSLLNHLYLILLLEEVSERCLREFALSLSLSLINLKTGSIQIKLFIK